MFIAIASDRTAIVVRDLSDIKIYCEAIDVLNGEYAFFSLSGMPYKAIPKSPDRTGWRRFVFGPTCDFTLEPDPEYAGPSLAALLDSEIALEQNAFFQTLDELRQAMPTTLNLVSGATRRDA